MMRRRRYDHRVIVGCKVRISDAGHSYTNWEEQTERMGMTGYSNARNGPYDEAKDGSIGIVSAIQVHPDGDHTLYGIRYGKKEYLVNEDGVIFVQAPNQFPEDLFEL